MVKTDEETGQTIISGMGELHLEIIIDRIRREFKVEANTGAPQIAYRETITKAAGGEGKLVKQSGGRGQYGHVILAMKPNEKGKGLTIENKVVGGTIPKEYINAVIKGVERGHDQRHHRRLSGHRRPCRDPRRLLPRGGLQRKRLHHGRHLRDEGRLQESQVHPARADHGRRSLHSGRLSGRRHGRPQPPPRPDPEHWNPKASSPSCMPMSLSRKCSATPPPSAPSPRAAPPMR